jgi:hypothetical protein
MAINNTPVPDARLNMKIRSLFLDHLAQTANVAASARAAGVSSNAVVFKIQQIGRFALSDPLTFGLS